MALRLSSEILHGEIDNRQPGRTTGLLHLLNPADWPPDPLFAGHTLHRLKTARRFVRDAQLAIDTAAADHLAPAEWTSSIAAMITEEILPELEQKIAEVRLILQHTDQHPDIEDENENPRG